MGDTVQHHDHCLSGTACRGDGQHPATPERPLCPVCLDHAAVDIRGLLYDYLDLAQLHEASLSQAPSETSGGSSGESPLLIAGHVEALQQEIAWVLSLWEHALRAVHQLSNPGTWAPLWRYTVYDHIRLNTGHTVLRKARPGAIIQRALTVIEPRLERLAGLPAITVCPTGIEDQPTPMAGWEAVHHLQDLHRRARSMLGRTRRILALYGICPEPGCGAEALYRQEPQRHMDEPPVWCDICKTQRPYADYERYMVELVWPASSSAAA